MGNARSTFMSGCPPRRRVNGNSQGGRRRSSWGIEPTLRASKSVRFVRRAQGFFMLCSGVCHSGYREVGDFMVLFGGPPRGRKAGARRVYQDCPGTHFVGPIPAREAVAAEGPCLGPRGVSLHGPTPGAPRPREQRESARALARGLCSVATPAELASIPRRSVSLARRQLACRAPGSRAWLSARRALLSIRSLSALGEPLPRSWQDAPPVFRGAGPMAHRDIRPQRFCRGAFRPR